MENEKSETGIQLKVIDTLPPSDNGGRTLSKRSVAIIEALKKLEYGKILEISNYKHVYNFRKNLSNWINKGHLKDEFMLTARHRKIYIWKVTDRNKQGKAQKQGQNDGN